MDLKKNMPKRFRPTAEKIKSECYRMVNLIDKTMAEWEAEHGNKNEETL
jgi:hypothetical protein